MKRVQKKARPNQKTRRAPHRDAGVFRKGNTVRIVELRPTGGFHEYSGEYAAHRFVGAKEANEPIQLRRGKLTRLMMPVQSNAPKIRHNKIG